MLLGVAGRRQTWAVIRATRGDVCWERSVNAQELLGTGQGALGHRCACTGVGASACTLSGQTGSPCSPGLPVTPLGCLGESHVWSDVPLAASPSQKGGGGWGRPVTQPPLSLHLLQPTSCWFWRWCQPRAAPGSGVRLPSAGGEPGASVSLPAAAGMGLERCRGRLLRAVSRIQGRCSVRGGRSGLRSRSVRPSRKQG